MNNQPSLVINRRRLLDRFLHYVQVDTTANDRTDNYPSSAGQLELGRQVVAQLREMGLTDAAQDEHGIVMATVPGNTAAPTIAFNAHFDTSPETTGANVRPRVIESYEGGNIPLTGDTSKTITVEKCPELAGLTGCTLITTDGTTLLGGDDKCGIAIIMELAQCLLENPDLKHGPVRVLFSCDEEIGRGALHVDVAKVDATAAYTFDGGGKDNVDVETFSADMATVTFTGVNIHPAIAKDKMVNAIRATSWFLDRLPRDASPEHTDGRAGFMHPYVIEGGVASTSVRILLRSFDTDQLAEYAEQLRRLASDTESAFPGCSVQVAVDKQYRNLGDGLKREPRAAGLAIQAHQNLGRKPIESIIRGGTDGSQFTEKGLPTPNLSSGQHNIHSPLEFACLDEMVAAVEVGLELVRLWGQESA